MNDLYVEYIKQWNLKKESTELQIEQSITDRYTQLLRDITLKYTTIDEKRFLANVDFTDELDVDIIIPFYSRKIREICDFYSTKRQKLKHKISKNKIKGTPTSLEKSIFETITDVVFSDVLEVGTYQKLVDEEILLSDLNIEVEELYDLYTSYLDNDPDVSYDTYDVKTELRKTLYSSNINAIDANIFINFSEAVKNQLFEKTRTFLVEFGRIFTINYDINSVDLNCKPDDKLYNIVNDNKPKAERLVKLKDSLIKKYIGSDFYYITTGSTITDVTSAILFKADNPSGNLLNRHFPTTATIEEESDLQSCRRIGLFFTPEKNSILYYSVPDKKYKIDSSKLEPNKLYIFPDPDRYGNTSGLSRTYNSEYPLIHIADYTRSVKNESCYSVSGDVNSNPYSQDFYAYFSRNQLSVNFNLGKEGLKTNFSELYDIGVMTKWATDIYGNQYGLFKPKSKKNLIDNSFVVEVSSVVCEDYDGGPITFSDNTLLPQEAYASNPSWVKSNVWASDYYYNILIEGGIGGFYKGLMERGLYEGYMYVEGLMIDRNQITTELFDIDLNKLSSLPEPNNLIPRPDKTLDGDPILIGSFNPSFSYNYILSSIKYKEFDAGYITDICEEKFDFDSQTKIIIDKTTSTSKTLTAERIQNDNINSFELRNSFGTIYIKDIVTGNVSHLSSALAIQFANKYSDNFNEIIDFNLYNDFLWIRTKTSVIFEKVQYETDKFVYSGTSNSFLSSGISLSYLYNVSNPFIFENRDYAMAVTLSAYNSNSNNFSIIPTIYKINYNTAIKTKIESNLPLSSYKNDATINPIKIIRINQPLLTYNTRNNLYSVVATVEDENEFAYIYRMNFNYNGAEILNQKISLYNFSAPESFRTINFYDQPSLNENNIKLNDITDNTSLYFNDGTLVLN